LLFVFALLFKKKNFTIPFTETCVKKKQDSGYSCNVGGGEYVAIAITEALVQPIYTLQSLLQLVDATKPTAQYAETRAACVRVMKYRRLYFLQI
jgi:hypothetical protein